MNCGRIWNAKHSTSVDVISFCIVRINTWFVLLANIGILIAWRNFCVYFEESGQVRLPVQKIHLPLKSWFINIFHLLLLIHPFSCKSRYSIRICLYFVCNALIKVDFSHFRNICFVGVINHQIKSIFCKFLISRIAFELLIWCRRFRTSYSNCCIEIP